MAAIDNGVLVMKNGKLTSEFIDFDTAIINKMAFHRNIIMEQKRYELMQKGDYEDYPDLFYALLSNKFWAKRRRTWHFEQNGMHYSAREVGDGIYWTKFAVDLGDRYDFYDVLQGYDVSTYGVYKVATKRLIEKFTRGQVRVKVLPHVFY